MGVAVSNHPLTRAFNIHRLLCKPSYVWLEAGGYTCMCVGLFVHLWLCTWRSELDSFLDRCPLHFEAVNLNLTNSIRRTGQWVLGNPPVSISPALTPTGMGHHSRLLYLSAGDSSWDPSPWAAGTSPPELSLPLQECLYVRTMLSTAA